MVARACHAGSVTEVALMKRESTGGGGALPGAVDGRHELIRPAGREGSVTRTHVSRDRGVRDLDDRRRGTARVGDRSRRPCHRGGDGTADGAVWLPVVGSTRRGRSIRTAGRGSGRTCASSRSRSDCGHRTGTGTGKDPSSHLGRRLRRA